MVITNFGVFEINDNGMKLVELAPGITIEDVKASTEATFEVAV